MTAKQTTRKPAPKKAHKIINKVPVIQQVTIKQVDNGYIVKVGCKTLVVNSAKVLCEALQDYLERPGVYEDALEDEEEEDQPAAGPAMTAFEFGESMRKAMDRNAAYRSPSWFPVAT